MRSRLHTRASTQARDRSLLDSLILPRFGPTELRRIAPVDVHAWISGLVGDGYAPATIEKAYTILKLVLVAAVESDMLARSPLRGIKLPQGEREEMRTVTVGELGILLEEIPSHYRLLVATAAYTGLRFGELAGLRTGDIDPLRRTLTVRRGIVEVSGRIRVEEPKTAASRRTVALPVWLAEDLAAHLANHNAEYVFTAPTGGRCDVATSVTGCGSRRRLGRVSTRCDSTILGTATPPG
jgi:integrase